MNDQNNFNQGQQGPQGKSGGSDEKMLAILCHVLGILTSFVGPLVMYFISEDKPFVKDHAKEALNFQITLLIAYIVSGLLWFVCIGTILTFIIWIAAIVFGIMAAMAVNNGQPYKYPFSIRLVK
ncbi:MAG: DUF4870 domain-containing protein [Clostridiales bacterium]